ncbi:hypothetical protein ACI6PO_20890 [Agrobacterium tumefaciens]
MFLLRVEFTGAQPFQIIVPLQCLELLLQNRCCLHRREDAGNPAVDFE